jgi:hypothetical protein
MSIKQQLQDYYVSKGVTGKRLRSAVLKDIIRVRHYSTFEKAGGLIGAFVWSNAPEGFYYWRERASA